VNETSGKSTREEINAATGRGEEVVFYPPHGDPAAVRKIAAQWEM
jgi:hypothetical protein